MAVRRIVAGISDHAGWAVVMCVASGGKVLDRRRVVLVPPGLPVLPHHHEAQGVPLAEGVALVKRVRAAADRCAAAALDGLPAGVGAIAIRKRPELPPTIAERITSYWAQTRADSVMYRDALAEAASARGWSVHEYDPKSVFDEAARSMGLKENIDAWLERVGKELGPPWQKDHRMAVAGALGALRAPSAR